MATATSTHVSYGQSVPSSSSVNSRIPIDSTLSKQNHGFFTNSKNPAPPRLTHCLDDMDILALKRQYANINLFEQSILSSSAEDLSQLDRIPYQFEVFGQDPDDMDDYDLAYDDGNGYDYFISIQERLKKANEEFAQDQTSVELKHPPRVSFDSIVKAVDIIQDPAEYDNADKPSVSPVVEEPSTSITDTRSENSTHAYTVPLNDTHPKQGPTLIEQIKASQFYNTPPTDERWATTTNNVNNNNSATREDDKSASSFKSKENNNDTQDTSNSTSPRKPMVVSVNGQFVLQDEDDYTAKHHHKVAPNVNNKILFLPTPPTEPKQKQDKPPRPFPVRPKSSEGVRRTDTNLTRSSSDKKNKTETKDRQRPKSAGVSKSVETFIEKPTSGVDFDELLRKAAEKKRKESREERRKKEEDDEKRKKELAKAKESYERWLEDKNSERKRINEEKKLEKEEQQARQVEQEKELDELREKKFKEWIERKDQQVMIANEYAKLKNYEEEMATRGSPLSMNNTHRTADHRAFRRWLRQKYQQSLEEKRQLRLEAKQLRRRQRRSLKRYQLQQDLQLAKSYGYS